MTDREEREKRAEARRSAGHSAIRSFRLGEEPSVDERIVDTSSERLLRLARLSRYAFRLSGSSLPNYSRETMPGRVTRGAQ